MGISLRKEYREGFQMERSMIKGPRAGKILSLKDSQMADGSVMKGAEGSSEAEEMGQCLRSQAIHFRPDPKKPESHLKIWCGVLRQISLLKR